jgi:catechol 2,3-dioxygenase-like lactoylglutathione lyase family enzyme
MKPFIKVITLGVDDLERSLAFYRDGLGLPTEGIVGTEFEHGAVVFFQRRHGLFLALWPKTSLAAEAKVPTGAPSAVEFTLANNVNSREEVDAVMAQAAAAGPTRGSCPQRSWQSTWKSYDAPNSPNGFARSALGHGVPIICRAACATCLSEIPYASMR